MMYRHGDVSLTKTNLPKGAKKVYSGNEYVAAEGEVTGHAHRIQAPALTVWEFGGEQFVVVQDDAQITHEEHGTKPLAPGTYKIGIQEEYDPFDGRLRQVSD